MSVELAIELTAYAMTFLSAYLYARKSLWGPIIGALDVIPWTVVAIKSGVLSLIIFNLVYTVIHLYALFHWRKSYRQEAERRADRPNLADGLHHLS